jgi:diguanylate cyclase (GGDEF)-like protein/PAS domain S-box-containing protein
MSFDPRLLQSLLDAAPDGMVVCELRGTEWFAIYSNTGMQQLTGFAPAEIVGRPLSFLQADDREQEGVQKVRDALRERIACHAILRNYRRDGTMFWNDMRLVPLPNADGTITHYAGFHRDGGERLRIDPLRSDAGAPAENRDPAVSTQTMLAYLRDDKLTGLVRRPYFEELMRRDWALAQRESRRLNLIVFDLDHFSQYREVFGRPGADQSFRRIARAVGSSFRRASDLCGRFDEDQIAAFTTGTDLAQAAKLAESVLARVRDLAIHHPRSGVSRYITASAGVVSWVPPHEALPEHMMAAALKALKEAKDQGRNRVVSKECA